MELIRYIKSLSDKEIKDIYSYNNGALQFPEKQGFGEEGAFEFLGAILLSEFIPSLGKPILKLCQKVCKGELSPLQFSDLMDEVIHSIPFIAYEEWSAVFRYLKSSQEYWAKNEWFYQRSKILSPYIQKATFTTPLATDTPFKNEIFKAAGVTFDNRQELLKNLSKGELLALKREYNNQFDTNAIALHNVLNQQLGYVPKEKAAYLAPYIDKGDNLFAEVVEITGGNDHLNYGFKFKLT